MLLLALLVAGCGGTSSQPQTQTPAERLAAYQEGVSSVSVGDPLVAQLAGQLDLLEQDCTETQDKLAAKVWASWTDLQKNGVDETILSLIEHVRSSIPASLAPTDCAQIMAAYLVLREG